MEEEEEDNIYDEPPDGEEGMFEWHFQPFIHESSHKPNKEKWQISNGKIFSKKTTLNENTAQ